MLLIELLRCHTIKQISCAVQSQNPADLTYQCLVISWLQNRERINSLADIQFCVEFFIRPAISLPLRHTLELLSQQKLVLMQSIYSKAFGEAKPAPIKQLSQQERANLYQLTLRDINRRGVPPMFTINEHTNDSDFFQITDVMAYWQTHGISNPLLRHYLALYLNAEFLLAVGTETQAAFIEHGVVLVEEKASLAEVQSSPPKHRLSDTLWQQIAPWVYQPDRTIHDKSIVISSESHTQLRIIVNSPFYKLLNTHNGGIHALEPPFIIRTEFVLQDIGDNEVLFNELKQQYINVHVLPWHVHMPKLLIAHDPNPLRFNPSASRCSSPLLSPSPMYFTPCASPIKPL